MDHAEPDSFRLLLAWSAIVAPLVHSLTDALEWWQGGFSTAQLLLNYLAFLPLCWLLLGLAVTLRPRPGAAALIGALLYGVAFTYFAFTTLYALVESLPDYAALWQRLGVVYTLHGGFMVVGGLLFAVSVWKVGALPRWALACFAGGLLLNLTFALIPVADLMQTLGSALRNAGLVGMGVVLLRRAARARSEH